MSLSMTLPLCTSALASVRGGVPRQAPQFVGREKRYMDGGGDPIGVAAYLGHTGSSIQLPQCLFADADSVEFDDGFSGNVSCLHKLTY
jgi:hypothetical protein